MVAIAPSILSADFSKLADEIRNVEAGGADLIHVDVMDGHFVPNITLGPLVVAAIRPHTALPLDVHLMISEPDRYIVDFATAGADLITVHTEACPHLHRTVQLIKEQGKKAGVALNPATSLSTIESILPDLDLVLLMTVNPGFGGQRLIESVLPKIAKLRQTLEQMQCTHIDIEVDGGVNDVTIGSMAKAGANIFVAGNAIFTRADRRQAIEELRGIANAVH